MSPEKALREFLMALTDATDRLLATGDFGGRLQTWDLERPDEPLTSTAAHSGLVNAIDGGGGKVLFFTLLMHVVCQP